MQNKTIPNMAVVQEAVRKRVNECLQIIKAKSGKDIPFPNIEWMAIKGTDGARANYVKHSLLINWSLLVHNMDEYLDQIIPHEMAHLVAYKFFGNAIKGKPHGVHWKFVMGLLERPADRCHKLDVSSVERPTFTYFCKCGDHKVSTRKHNLIESGKKKFVCVTCKAVIQRKVAVLNRR